MLLRNSELDSVLTLNELQNIELEDSLVDIWYDRLLKEEKNILCPDRKLVISTAYGTNSNIPEFVYSQNTAA